MFSLVLGRTSFLLYCWKLGTDLSCLFVLFFEANNDATLTSSQPFFTKSVILTELLAVCFDLDFSLSISSVRF